MSTTNTARLLVAVVAVVACAACAKPWMIPNDKPITLAPNEGLVAFASDADGTVSIALCQDADLARCVELGPVSRDRDVMVVVSRVHEGRHCIMQIALELADTGAVETNDPSQSQCFDVRAGRITYPGHFVVEQENIGNTSFFKWRARWDDRGELARSLIDRAYPHLANIEMRKTRVVGFVAPDD